MHDYNPRQLQIELLDLHCRWSALHNAIRKEHDSTGIELCFAALHDSRLQWDFNTDETQLMQVQAGTSNRPYARL